MWNYGKLSAKFLVRRVKDIDTVGFLSGFFFQILLEQLLKFLLNSFFNESKVWSISASNTGANSVAFIMKEGGNHLNFAIPQRDHKNFTHTTGGITKNLQNFKNFQKPPPGKK